MRVAAAVTALTLPLLPQPAAATADGCWDIAWRCHELAAIHGPLDQDRDLQDQAKAWAREMADSGILRHAEDVSGGEAVGMAPDWLTVMAAWEGSSCLDGTWPRGCPGHRELILDRDFTQVGIGSALGADGMRYYVLRFQ